MSLVTTILAILSNAALGLWLGSIVFFSFLGAPTIFSVLEEDAAGRAVNAIFPRYYLFGLGLGAVALAAGAGRAVVGAAEVALATMLGAVAVGLVANAYARWVLIPRMEAAGEAGFEQYHRQSVILNSVTMLAVAVALVASHL